MESGGMCSILQNRRLESYFERKSLLNSDEVASKAAEEMVRPSEAATEVFSDDEGWFTVMVSWIRIITCFLTMMVTTSIWALIMLVLLPWPCERIRQGNIYGHVTGSLLMWILGNSVKIEGVEYSDKRAIYISNHASPIDIFLTMWLIPTGTVGIAKKEVARAVVKNNLSLIIFPEGTRSKNGRLLPFKKGFVHLALQTRLPIIPIIMTGTHNAWRKGSLHIRPTPINVKYLPPIKTEDWTKDQINEYVDMVHDVYAKHLPESQKPVCHDTPNKHFIP